MDHPVAAAWLQEHQRRIPLWNVYSKIHNLCVQGGFYRHHQGPASTTGANSKARRSAQTALYHQRSAGALDRTDPGLHRRRAVGIPAGRACNESVMLNTWYEGRPNCRPTFRIGPRVLGRRHGRLRIAIGSSTCGQGRGVATCKLKSPCLPRDGLIRRLRLLSKELRFVPITLHREPGTFRPGPGRCRGH